MKRLLFSFLPLMIAATSLLPSCGHIDLFEKTVTVPGHAWHSHFKPDFDFEINDTSQVYEVFVVIRHTEKYRYNNLFITLQIQRPDEDSALTLRRELELASNERWLGEGMDDIYEHRIPVLSTRALKPGLYHFRLEQIMREDPLEHVLDVGIRVEKK